ncbi:hypothetical protein GPUN_1249 [Glaciecola punicea ACAM 611]|uniref:Transmembrane protein n=1 Tax=Glaciecola punicea ACAM 611 TaxID=1121923 RepID=H5TAP6_9ALTE|nr:hypothetical protein [Glaciecola punicea]GAB55373.1 hypothetical protein GPUN_1249 [Glaciecola punicea ACAM 611]
MSAQNTKNKRSLLLLIAVFVLPVIFAFMALKLDWFNQAVTNRGELLQPVIEASSLVNESDTKWHLLYIIPDICDLACDNALYAVKQIFMATGKHADRVNALFIYSDTSSAEAVAKAKAFTSADVLNKSNENVSEVFKNTDINAIFISDTLHNVVLRYPVTTDKEQAIMDSRDILADLKKLLKLSRIG